MSFPIRPVLIFFAVLVPIYFATFFWIERTREKDGPWTLTFQADSEGRPSLQIRQTTLGVALVEVRFPEEKISTNGLPVTVTLDKPLIPLPFGQRVSEDLTFRPGVETLDLFGHEVEIAPRVLVLNRREIPWQPNAVHVLKSEEKIPLEKRTPKSKRPTR